MWNSFWFLVDYIAYFSQIIYLISNTIQNWFSLLAESRIIIIIIIIIKGIYIPLYLNWF